MMTLSVKETLAKESAASLSNQMNSHCVHGLRALNASIIAKECHKVHYGPVGQLGAANGAVVLQSDEFRLNTELGYIGVRNSDFTAVPYVTHAIRVEFVGLQINETNETYDEPYVVMSVVALAPDFGGEDQLVTSQLIKLPDEDYPKDYIYSKNVTITNIHQIVGGTGIEVVVYAYEEDSGDPDEVAKDIYNYLQKSAKEGAKALGEAFHEGSKAGSVADSPEFQWILDKIAGGLGKALGDDKVGTATKPIYMSEIIELAKMTEEQYRATITKGPKDMRYNQRVEVQKDSDSGKYTIYFRVSAIEVPPIPKFPTP